MLNVVSIDEGKMFVIRGERLGVKLAIFGNFHQHKLQWRILVCSGRYIVEESPMDLMSGYNNRRIVRFLYLESLKSILALNVRVFHNR